MTDAPADVLCMNVLSTYAITGTVGPHSYAWKAPLKLRGEGVGWRIAFADTLFRGSKFPARVCALGSLSDSNV